MSVAENVIDPVSVAECSFVGDILSDLVRANPVIVSVDVGTEEMLAVKDSD